MNKLNDNRESNTKSDAKEDSTANTNKKMWFLIAGAVVVIAALVVVIIMLLTKKDAAPPEPVTSGRGTVATSENAREIASAMSEPVPDGYYMTMMNVEWRFATWDTPSGNAYVENSTDNTRTVYFDVLLDDTDELVYSSPFIPVGAKHEKFALDKELAAGEYPATVTYHLVDDDNNELTTLSVAVTLEVQG